MQQLTLIDSVKDTTKTHIGRGIILEVRGGKNGTAIQYDRGGEIKRVDLSDKTAKRIFIVDRSVFHTDKKCRNDCHKRRYIYPHFPLVLSF